MPSESSIQSLSFSISGNPIHFLRWGSGPELLIAIPGYGERAGSYNEWEKWLSPRFTCYALDLPFHGSSRWEQPFFKPADLIQLLGLIRDKEPGKPLTIAAYSMGGRLLLSSLSAIHFPIHRLILIAPDGINTPGLNVYLQFSAFVTPLSSFLLNRPVLSERLLSFLFQIKLLNRRNFLFLQRQLIHNHRRIRLLFWTRSLPQFPVKTSRVTSLLDASAAQVILIIGRRDRVVPPKGLRRFGKSLESSKVIEVDSNHQILEAGIGSLLAQLLSEDR
jgi:pimeloyl-ACP methyl ester carboxylesterase